VRAVAVTGLGVVCPIGLTPEDVAAAALSRRSGLTLSADLQHLPDARAGCVERIPIRAWLKRRKDRKLMARASELALAAAGPALHSFVGERVDLGLFLGVGREPPDDGESEAALAAAARNGRLDTTQLAGRGRDLYPPLLPLKTLPNMALAHISINLGLMGENGAWAGEAGAGQRAVVSGIRAIEEARLDAALVGGSDSLVGLGSARDRLRMARTGPPGEAGAMLCLEALSVAQSRGAPVLAIVSVGESGRPVPSLRPLVGDVGAAAVPLELVAAIAGGLVHSMHIQQAVAGDVSGAISVAPPPPC